MVTSLERYRESVQRRRLKAHRANYRLDVQGLRAVAVLAVIAHHLWGWPRGGFVGVDVFFVIAGFFVTVHLLTTAEYTGSVSLRAFYGERLRRIVPAAAVVLALTVAASALALPPPGGREVGVDALFAVAFAANWHFATQGVDWSSATDSVSPLLHYWPLSVEGQLYAVWPVPILVISLIAVRSAWSHARWLLLTGGLIGVTTAASLGWALYETATAPAWAYFSTASRMWELGAGALLATMLGPLARIPVAVKPVLSWAGLALIGAGMILIGEQSAFPAPWALLPVAGALLVISAGVDGEPLFQGLLGNRVSTYLGDISYSLYLVHWPVVVVLATMMATSAHYYLAALALTFGLAIALHHLIEVPLRYATWEGVRQARHDLRHGLHQTELSTKLAAVAALVLLAVSLITYAMRPDAYSPKPVAPTPCCAEPR